MDAETRREIEALKARLRALEARNPPQGVRLPRKGAADQIVNADDIGKEG